MTNRPPVSLTLAPGPTFCPGRRDGPVGNEFKRLIAEPGEGDVEKLIGAYRTSLRLA